MKNNFRLMMNIGFLGLILSGPFSAIADSSPELNAFEKANRTSEQLQLQEKLDTMDKLINDMDFEEDTLEGKIFNLAEQIEDLLHKRSLFPSKNTERLKQLEEWQLSIRKLDDEYYEMRWKKERLIRERDKLQLSLNK